jgi:hypothetical protein
MKLKLKQSKAVILIALLSFTLIQCASVNNFSQVDKSKTITPGSIAVLCGSNTEAEITLAGEITKNFAAKSTFQVMSQKDIEKIIPQYPMLFLEEQKSDTDQWSLASNHLTDKNMATVSKLQEKLKVQYIMLVWIQNYSFKNSGSNCCLSFFLIGSQNVSINAPVRVLSYPEKKVIAYNNINTGDDYSALRSPNSSMEALLTTVADKTVDKFLESVPAGRKK